MSGVNKTIRRGPAPRRAIQQSKRKPRAQRKSIIDRAITALPISEITLRRIATWTIMTGIGAATLAVAIYLGVPQAAGVAVAEEIGKAGLRVEGIEITGAKRMNPMTVYAVVLEQKSRAMPLVDLEGVRQKLLQYGWIADAQVSRRLPNKLVVNIIERQPAAIWQDKGQLTLIDANGVLLEPVSADAMPDLPLVIGDGANEQAPAYRALLDTAPALRPLVKAATWVGNRRWNLTFETGETLALPEEEPSKALLKFAELDGTRSLLGKGWLRFDMRDPSRLVVRRPGFQSQRSITDTSSIDAGSTAAGSTGAGDSAAPPLQTASNKEG